MLAWQRNDDEKVDHMLRLSSPGDIGRIVPHTEFTVSYQLAPSVDSLRAGRVPQPLDGFRRHRRGCRKDGSAPVAVSTKMRSQR